MSRAGWGCRIGDLVEDAKHIIDSAQRSAYQAVNVALVVRNWLLGRRIAEEELAIASIYVLAGYALYLMGEATAIFVG